MVVLAAVLAVILLAAQLPEEPEPQIKAMREALQLEQMRQGDQVEAVLLVLVLVERDQKEVVLVETEAMEFHRQSQAHLLPVAAGVVAVAVTTELLELREAVEPEAEEMEMLDDPELEVRVQ